MAPILGAHTIPRSLLGSAAVSKRVTVIVITAPLQ